jgi:hypothetical protein
MNQATTANKSQFTTKNQEPPSSKESKEKPFKFEKLGAVKAPPPVAATTNNYVASTPQKDYHR